MAAGVPVVLAGDHNVVPTEADIWPGHHEQANALLQPESRAPYQRLLGQGWTDALRTLQPEGPLWTFWGTCAIAGRTITACGWIACCSVPFCRGG